jgi:hypothetical protein
VDWTNRRMGPSTLTNKHQSTCPTSRTQVAALTWWGEDAIVVVARHRTGFSLRIYPRNHLDNASLLNDPLPLPPGTRPLFLECVKDREGEGGTLFRHRERSRGRVPTAHSSGGGRRPSLLSSSSSDTAAGDGGNPQPPAPAPAAAHAQQKKMGDVYWTESAVLMVGDADFLLFYRLARDHSPTGVSVSFLYDLPLPLFHHRNNNTSTSTSTSDTTAAVAACAAGAPPAAPSSSPFSAAAAAGEGERGSVGIPVESMGAGETPKRIVLLPGAKPRTVAVLSSTGTLYRCVHSH